ncbi:MAG: DNA polymerase II large subunit [archaeon]
MSSTVSEAGANYSKIIRTTFDEIYRIAESARRRGFDPAHTPECVPTSDVAERVEKSVGLPGVAVRIRELTKVMPREEVAFKVAEEIIRGKFGPEVDQEATAERAIRTALSILDEGRTVASIQGISGVKIKTNPDRSRYLSVYFAGPIRSAGGTEMGLTLVIADFVRGLVGLDRYKATEEEVHRFVEELRLHEREVVRFQFRIPDEEVMDAIKRLPIEVNGVQTDHVEVTSFRNLPRIETNRVRGGALRVVNDGLIGRAQKIVKIIDKVGIDGWNWLKEIHGVGNEEEGGRELAFMDDVIGGRPIFSLPGRHGGFRLRYGRSRNTGMAALGVHPATMAVLKNFIAAGTQLRTEMPGKAGVAAPVESIEPPVVRLGDGSVVRVSSVEQANQLSKSIEAILFVGDLLVAYGEFLENNRLLAPSGFVEEWWAEIVEARLKHKPEALAGLEAKGLTGNRIVELSSTPLESRPTINEALAISSELQVPLHPTYIFFWEAINSQDLDYLRQTLACSKCQRVAQDVSEIIIPLEKRTKAILESLVVPHSLDGDSLIISGENAQAIHSSLGLEKMSIPIDPKKDVFDNLQTISGLDIRRKTGTIIGVRMGRPEKAKRREMKPLVHCLFPISSAGGPQRNLVQAARRSLLSVQIVKRKCNNCGDTTHEPVCRRCGIETAIDYICPRCGRSMADGTCGVCKIATVAFDERNVDLKGLLQMACKRLGISNPPELIKGVKGLMSEARVPEPLEKGILRAKYDLSVFKDGTIRFDATNAPLTHFRPSEIGVSPDRLRELGYHNDCNGSTLTDPNQLCELRDQDIVVSESCVDYLMSVAGYIDELLEKFYGLEPFYSIKRRADLAGHLVFGLSPHTSVGIIGRIIGFTNMQVCMAHPIWHAAKRRDCDGDEDGVILGLDGLLNFSRSFLPGRIGGLMDAPLLLTVRIEPTEVARQAFNMEIINRFPLEFYEQASAGADPKSMTGMVQTVAQRLDGEAGLQGIGFTHNVSSLSVGNRNSLYKELSTMLEKVEAQLELANMLVGVDAADVAKRVLSTHIMRDVTGNLKAFSTQKFRCTSCNTKFRRVPLKGTCPKCGGKISLTVYRGTIEKYIHVANDLVRKYNLGDYHEQRLRLISDEIETLFMSHEKKTQHVLAEFV